MEFVVEAFGRLRIGCSEFGDVTNKRRDVEEEIIRRLDTPTLLMTMYAIFPTL